MVPSSRFSPLNAHNVKCFSCRSACALGEKEKRGKIKKNWEWALAVLSPNYSLSLSLSLSSCRCERHVVGLLWMFHATPLPLVVNVIKDKAHGTAHTSKPHKSVVSSHLNHLLLQHQRIHWVTVLSLSLSLSLSLFVGGSSDTRQITCHTHWRARAKRIAQVTLWLDFVLGYIGQEDTRQKYSIHNTQSEDRSKTKYTRAITRRGREEILWLAHTHRSRGKWHMNELVMKPRWPNWPFVSFILHPR